VCVCVRERERERERESVCVCERERDCSERNSKTTVMPVQAHPFACHAHVFPKFAIM
jgi:hypothetical protein